MNTDRPIQGTTFTIFKRSLITLLALSLSLGNIPVSYGQIVADPNAAANQRPQVTTPPNTNNIPVVNIVAPNGAGVSHNIYITGQENQTANLTNRATITARQTLIADVSHISNQATGHLHANDLALQSATDIDDIGGVISADNSITLVAARDIHISSTVSQGYDSTGQRNNIGNTGLIYLSGQATTTQSPGPQNQEADPQTNPASGQIRIQAGRDIHLNAGVIINDAVPSNTEEQNNHQNDHQDNSQEETSRTGDTTLVAGRNINLGTVTTSQSQNVDFARRNNRSESTQTEIGSQITAQGHINLIAQSDLTIRASNLESAQGAINGSAASINIQAGNATQNQRVETYNTNAQLLSTSSRHNIDQRQDQSLIGSSLSAEQINLQATQDITITASNIVATDDVNLISTQGNITVQSATGTTDQYHYERIRQSGLLSGDGTAITVGRSQTTTTEATQTTYAQASTVGSLEGSVNILAQNGTYTQTGSDLLALQGDINAVAQDITIQEARQTERNTSTYDFKQTGVTVGFSGPIMAAVQTAQQMDDAAERSRENAGSTRMQALAAGAGTLNLYNTIGSVGNLATPAPGASVLDAATNAGFSLSLSIGSSKASSRTEDTSNTAASSSLNAGGNINLVATGQPLTTGTPSENNEQKPTYTGGNITIQGSNITAQNNVTLVANDASNTTTHSSTNKSSSASMGVSYGAGGWGINGSFSQSRGNSNGQEQSWTASRINAGNTATLISGGDTHIIGSQVVGNTVIANIGGDLNIQSLQDTSTGHSESQSTGGGFSANLSGGLSAGSFSNPGLSINSGKARADGSYASVNDYAGIMAGDGGYNITVAGNTDLQGAIIASTQEAVNHNRNQLTTGSLTVSDIQNSSNYDAKGSSMGIGILGGGGSSGYGKESGHDRSTTVAGISGGQITITNEQAQQNRTGQSAQDAINNINTNIVTGQNTNSLTQNWDTDQLLANVQAQTEITAQFGQSATKAVGDYGAHKERQALALLAQAQILEATDPQAAAELRAQGQAMYDNWKEGGTYRVLAHTVIGGLTGDWSGAVGAGSSALAAGHLNDITKDLPPGVREAVGAGLAAGLGSLTGGNAGMSAALNQDLNNRQLHPEEIIWIRDHAKNEDDFNNLLAAACFIITCSAEYPQGSEQYQNYLAMEERGGSEELAPYREQLQNAYANIPFEIDDGLGTIVTGNTRAPLFTYTRLDERLDILRLLDNTTKFTNRLIGTIEAGTGAAITVGASGVGAATCAETFGAGCLIGAAGATYGFDLSLHGVNTIYTGERTHTWSAQGLSSTTGITPDQAELVLGIGSGLGALGTVSKGGSRISVIYNPAHNAASYQHLRRDLEVMQTANPVVESLRTTGQLPSHYVNKAQAVAQGWQPGKALNNSVPGGQLGGDIFYNTTNILPSSPGRVWYEADIGISNAMSRGNQAGTRLLYSDDGLLYITTDHYKTVTPFGTWK